MNDSGSGSPPRARRLAVALGRGFLGRCPNCGQGKLLTGYISPTPDCQACREHLAPYQAADFAPYIVTFVIGLIFTPLIAVLAVRGMTAPWIPVLFGFAVVASALLLLPRAKGAAIALLWALDIKSNV
jgi:uncharacterized protein (DUF983 family)